MKNSLLFVFFLTLSGIINAQWTPVPITGSNANVTSMFTYLETLMVGTAGDGIFKTENNGANWSNINGNLGNLLVNDIRGGGGPTVIWVATEGGAFFTIDQTNYINASAGLTNTDVNYYWLGDSYSLYAGWAIGTNGGGIFISPEVEGPWTSSSTGLTGDGLIVNDIGGYDDEDIYYAVAATDGGVYFSFDTLVTWIPKNGGLSGDALKVRSLITLGQAVLIATRNGIYYSVDMGDMWIPIIPSGKFNRLYIYIGLTGMSIYGVGEQAYYTPDLLNFYQLNLEGLTGEISCIAQNSTHVFMGTTSDGKDGKLAGGIFRKPVSQLITDVPAYTMPQSNAAHLQQNTPNPAVGSTTLSFILEKPGQVRLTLFDHTGKLIRVLMNEYRAQGSHVVTLDVTDLPAGLYVYTLEIQGMRVQSRKMVVSH